MKQTFLVFLLTLFLCGSASAYSVMFDKNGTDDDNNLFEVNQMTVTQTSVYNEDVDDTGEVFAYQDENTGLFTEQFIMVVDYGINDTYPSSSSLWKDNYENLYLNIQLDGQYYDDQNISFTSGNVTMFHDKDEDIEFGGTDATVATLSLEKALISSLSGGLLGETGLKMNTDFIFKYTSVNSEYWGTSEEELTNKGWLISFFGSTIAQEYVTEPIYDGGIGDQGNDRIIKWDITSGQVEFNAVPEPATLILLGIGLLGLAGLGRKKWKS